MDLEFGVGGNESIEADRALCLVGRFLTDRNIRVPIMKDRWVVCFPVFPSTGYTKSFKTWAMDV